MPSEFRKASDVINALFSGFDSEGMRQSNAFVRGWSEAVGEKIASHSRVIDVDRGVLTVEVDHPGWNQQIQYMKKRVLGTLSRSFPELELKTLVVRVRTEGAQPYKRQDAPVGQGVTRMTPERDSEHEADVPLKEGLDPELKDIFSRLKESIKRGKPN